MLALGVYTNADRLGLDFHDERGDVMRDLSYLDQHEEEPPPEEQDDSDDEMGAMGVRFEDGQRHKGAEGKMGKPTSKSKSGVYAMKGPKDAIPQMAREYDRARAAGILGVMNQQGGQFLASPYGGAYGVGNDDADVWGGLTGDEVGQAHGVGGLGLVGVGEGGGGMGSPFSVRRGAERYAPVERNHFIPTKKDRKSTFSIDVDTASYANVRRFLLEGNSLPPPEAVRTEELINYFDYDYVVPSDAGAPFSVTTEVGPSVWDDEHRLVHIGIQGHIPVLDEVPARNLVFLLDVSGSMSSYDKLPLVKFGLNRLAETLDDNDRVSIVVYAGAAGAVLEPTPGSELGAIRAALNRLQSGGSTNGSDGIELAYELAQRSFIKDGINRVILASDGDFNVGISDHGELVKLIERERKSGVFLSVLGVGTGNFNDKTMEQLADKGNGNYAYIDSSDEAQRVLVDQAGAMLQTIAKDVKIQVEFDPNQIAEHRLVGYENRVLAHRDFDDDTKDAGEIGAGHSVTAIYEVLPKAGYVRGVAPGAMMTLNLRYKQPDASFSRKIMTPVLDGGMDLESSSNDYRFSAAVAAFAESLRGVHDELSYTEIFELAAQARGADSDCYRHQFLQLVQRAGSLSGESMAPFTTTCERGKVQPRTQTVEVEDELDAKPEFEPEVVPTVEPELHIHTVERARPEWMTFTLEVLRLLPPLLALPLFFIAARPPRRRKRR